MFNCVKKKNPNVEIMKVINKADAKTKQKIKEVAGDLLE